MSQYAISKRITMSYFFTPGRPILKYLSFPDFQISIRKGYNFCSLIYLNFLIDKQHFLNQNTVRTTFFYKKVVAPLKRPREFWFLLKEILLIEFCSEKSDIAYIAWPEQFFPKTKPFPMEIRKSENDNALEIFAPGFSKYADVNKQTFGMWDIPLCCA